MRLQASTVATAATLLLSTLGSSQATGQIARRDNDAGTPDYFPGATCTDKDLEQRVLDKLGPVDHEFMACADCTFEIYDMSLTLPQSTKIVMGSPVSAEVAGNKLNLSDKPGSKTGKTFQLKEGDETK